MANKVKFGLKNVHFAEKTVSELGVVSYGTPQHIPGAVDLSLEPRGEMEEFYADDMLYYAAKNNQGYDGTINIALLTDAFRIAILGETKDSNGLILESSNDKGKQFALLFEFDGDESGTRHVLYNCSANRPTISAETKGENATPQPDELTFVASAREGDQMVKLRTSSETPAAIYDAWYDAVTEPGSPAPAA